ncbi:hypothetical protein Tco_0002916 [Tanacetum coccineum]
MKNYESRPTGSAPLSEANMVAYNQSGGRGRGHGSDRGRGRGRGRGHGRGQGHGFGRVVLLASLQPNFHLLKLERLSWVPLEIRNKQTSMSADLCGVPLSINYDSLGKRILGASNSQAHLVSVLQRDNGISLSAVRGFLLKAYYELR